MIDIISENLFEQSFANDKENLLRMIGIVLNSEFYEPALSNPQKPNYIDPLFYDIWPIYQQVLIKLNQDIENSAKSGMHEDFIRILTNYKINLKNLGKCFENVDSERKLFRKLCIKMLKQILQWRRDGNFFKDENLKTMSSRLTMLNYEILKQSKERIESKVLKLENQNTELLIKCRRFEKKTKMLKKRLKNNQSQMKELLLCDQKLFSGNTSRISNTRGNLSPLLDANEVKKFDLMDSKGMSKNSTSPNNNVGGLNKSPSPSKLNKVSRLKTPPSNNRMSLRIKDVSMNYEHKEIDDHFSLQDIDFKQTERMFRESLGQKLD